MALSADKIRTIRTRMQQAFKVANGVTVYGGGYMALRDVGHATSAARGYAAPLANALGNIPLGGIAHRKVVGDTTAAVPPEVEISIDGIVLQGATITTTDITDTGKLVYLSDDDTLTLTEPTFGIPIGIVVRFLSASLSDVYLFSFGELCAIALGHFRYNMYLGSVDVNTANLNVPGGAKIDFRTGIPMQHHGEIVDFFALVDVAITGATTVDAIYLNLELNGTDLTGGRLEIPPTSLGVKLVLTTAQAITAANRFHKGDLLDIEGIEKASGDDLTAGRVDLYAVVKCLPGV